MPYRVKLPDVLEPVGDKCVPLFIPDDPDYTTMIVEHIRKLTLDHLYERDDENSALIVRDQWRERTFVPFIEAVINETGCAGGSENTGTCFRFDATNEIFQFYPNDPYTDPENLDDETQIASLLRWGRWDSADPTRDPFFELLVEKVSGFLGYFANDAMLQIDPAGIFANPITKLGNLIDIFTNFPFPYVLIEFSGTGELEVELLNVPLGGRAILIPDLDLSPSALWDTVVGFFDNGVELPPSWEFAELNRDVVSIPPETLASLTVEFEFTEDSDHTMHVVFIPTLNDEAPLLFPFGGIREIEACGNLVFKGGETGENYTKENYKLGSQVKRGFIMTTVDDICEGVVCAMEKAAQRFLLSSQASNILSGIEVDPDTGKVTVKPSTISSAPEVDAPDLQRADGAAFIQATKFSKVFADMNSKIGFTENILQKVVRSIVEVAEDAAEAAGLDAFVSAYKANTPGQTINASDLQEEIFCAGDFFTGVTNYALSLANENDLGRVLDLLANTPFKTAQKWYTEGLAFPRNDYLSYACYLVPALTITVPFADMKTSVGVQAPYVTPNTSGRRYRFEVSGNLVSDIGETYDGLYYDNGAGVLTQYTSNLWLSTLSIAPVNIPQYNFFVSGTTYAHEGTIATNGTNFQVISNSTVRQKNWISGELVVKIIDLGEDA